MKAFKKNGREGHIKSTRSLVACNRHRGDVTKKKKHFKPRKQ